MTIVAALSEFESATVQCDSLIANSHRQNADSEFLFPVLDRQQITTAAFLNMFIAWESFLETTISKYLIGERSINGNLPNKYASPPSIEAARAMIQGSQRYFDYANHEYVKKIVALYFANAIPFEPHMSSIVSELADMRIMRNAVAHKSSSTQNNLDTLALRIFGQSRPNILLYDLLMSSDPRHPGNTVYKTYRDKITVAATLIANG